MNQTPFGFYLSYLKEFKKEALLASFLGMANGIIAVYMTRLIGLGIDTMIGKDKVHFDVLFSILALFGGLTLLNSLAQWTIQRLGNKVAYTAVATVRKDTFYHLNRLPIHFYDQTAHGDVVSRFSNDLDQVAEATTAVFNSVFSGVTIVFISLGSMLLLSPLLTIVVLLSTALIFLVNWSVAKKSQQQFQQQQAILGSISGFLEEDVAGLKIIKGAQGEQESLIRFNSLNETLQQVGQKAQFMSSLTNPLSRFVDHVSYLSIGVIGGLLVINQTPGMTIGVISSFIIYSTQFSKPFIELSGILTQIQTAFASLQRVFNLTQEPLETRDAQEPQILPPLKGRITFKDVSFAYVPSQPLIQGFNLTVQAGQTVAIVGQTGAGKSTLVNLLMRFYEVDQGVISIDGIPIQQMTRKELRQSFGMVLQETWLFKGSIWDNLTFGRPDATKEDVIQACQEAAIYHFITTLPKGFDTIIGQGNLSLSEGQRQLMTIARVIISQPNMLILDEATSSIDTLTEKTIQRVFTNLMVGKTSFIIAHRLSTIKEADTILVMHQGNIVEIGNHDSLVIKQGGYYQELYNAQFTQKERANL